jgi:hypothetical protein
VFVFVRTGVLVIWVTARGLFPYQAYHLKSLVYRSRFLKPSHDEQLMRYVQ